MTIWETLVEQERKHAKKLVDVPSGRSILHRVTDKPDPETGQSIMISVRGTVRNGEPTDLTRNYQLGLPLRMAGED